MVFFRRQDAFEAEAVDVLFFKNVCHAMPVKEIGDAFFRFLADFVAALRVADENVDVLDVDLVNEDARHDSEYDRIQN